MKVNDYLAATYNGEDIRPRAKLGDGAEVSIQASKYAYCAPRHHAPSGFSTVEIGFPTVWPHADEALSEKSRAQWGKYADGDPNDPDEASVQVYGYVPVELVQEFCDAHGGIQAPEPKEVQP